MLYPEGHKVLVKPDTVESISEGGIIYPDSVRDSRQIAATRGIIIALGPLAEVYFSTGFDGVEKHMAKPGDRCVFDKYGGASLIMDREEHRVILDENVIGYLDDDEKEEPEARISMVK